MKKIISLLALLASTHALAGPAVIWGPTAVKTLKPAIDINGVASILTGSADPSAVATSAPAGSLYLRDSAGVYRKTDAGLSTNWVLDSQDVTIGTANGLSLSGQVLSMDAADATHTGTITTGTQTLAGDKTLNGTLTATNLTLEGMRSPAVGSLFVGQLPLSSVGIHNNVIGAFAGSLLTSGSFNNLQGYNAGATLSSGSYNAFFGDSAGGSVTSNYNVMIGAQATAGTSGAAVQNNFIGAYAGGAGANGSNNQLMGANAGYSLTSGSGNIMLGTNVGDTYLTTQSGNFIAGSDPWPITTVSFGNGKYNSIPAAYTIQGSGGLGTDIAGADIAIAGGAGTGTGAGGSVILKTAPAGSSGSALNAASERLRVDSTGAVVTGNVDVSANARIRGLTTAGPVSTDASGNISSAATLPIANGGTGQATANAGLNALLPNQASSAHKFLTTDGTDASWAPSASGGVNFIGQTSAWSADNTDDRNLESTVGNWLAFADAASSLPTDLTGGSPSVTCTRSTSNPLDGAASLLITKGASNLQGEGCSVVFNVQPAYQGAEATITFPLHVVSGSIVQGDVKAFVYDVTNSQLITPYNNDVLANGVVTATFPITARAGTPANQQYRLGLYFASTSTTAVTLRADDFSVSPGQAAYGLAGSNFGTSYVLTPAVGYGTVTASNIQARRVGDSLEVKGSWKNGTVAASTAYITLPSGLAIDYTKIQTSGMGMVGMYTNATVGGAISLFSGQGGVAFVDGSTTTQVFFGTLSGAGSDNIAKINVSSAASNGDNTTFFFTVPIAGWDANVTMAESSTFKISSYLANGTRVTGRNPDKLGEWSSYLRNGSAATFTETSGDPAILPSANGGLIAVYTGNGYGTADNANNPTRFKVFVGKNKPNVQIDAYQSVTSSVPSDPVDFRPQYVGTTDIGFVAKYDKASGIVTITRPIGSASATVHAPGMAVADGQQASGVTYWEITVSENALAVGFDDQSVIGIYKFASASTNIASGAQFTFETTVQDRFNAVSNPTSTWAWTAPKSGTYTVSINMDVSGAGIGSIYKNGSSYNFISGFSNTSNARYTGSLDIPLVAGDYLDLRANAATTVGQGSQISIKRAGN